MGNGDKRPTTAHSRVGPRQTNDLRRRAPKARLVQLVGESTGRAYRLSGETVIGRDPEAGISIDGDDISRRHARIWREASTGEWMIEDLGSKNGIQVNGIPVAAEILNFGDHLQIGGSILFAFTYYDQLEEQILRVQRMESVGALAGGVAHDFNNLLSVIVGNLDFLESRQHGDGLTDDAATECFDEMRQAATRGEQLIRKLFRFSRVDSDDGRQPTDFTRMAQEVVDLCRRAFNPNIEVRTAIAPALVINGDPSQLHQIMMNLVINARDAMPGGGVLAICAEQVDLAKDEAVVPYVPPGRYVRIKVSDTGEGMSPETQERVFEPFFSTKETDRGTGLGLSTVFALVRNHGGYIDVDSELGHGATFKLYLPAVDGGRPALITARVEDCAGAEAALFGADPPKVLLVDDDSAFVRTTGRLLREIGYNVVTATDGRSALELYESDQSIQLVLLDVLMPEMDGAQVMRRLKERDPKVKVLLISGRIEEQIDRPLMADALGFLAKPCGAVNLRRAIEDAFALGDSGTELPLS